MDLHRLGVDVRLESVVAVGKIRKGVSHESLLFDVSDVDRSLLTLPGRRGRSHLLVLSEPGDGKAYSGESRESFS
jgi:hypothetical protein